ncbi:hypothetical protein HPB50_028136 [Hyalomma asiaticum]|nr:hypothetical protein HPB50_028136 [Hyalomma asiaticum]
MDYSTTKKAWSDAETRAVISLWEEHLTDLRRAKRNIKIYNAIAEKLQALGFDKNTKEVKKKIENLGNKYRAIKRKQTGTGSGAISWPHYWDIQRFLGSLPLNDESLAEEGGFSQGSPAQEILEGIARGDVADNQPPSEGCLSHLPVGVPEPPCTSQAGTCPPAVDNSVSDEAESTPSSCEAGLGGSNEKEPRKRKRQPAPSTLIAQLLDEQRQLRLSLERRREREMELKEQQLQIFKDIAATDQKLLSVLEALAKK